MAAARVDFNTVDDSRRAGCVTGGHTRHLAHMTILAGVTFLEGRRVPVLVPHDFELDAEVHRDLVTGNAEFSFTDVRKFDDVRVDLAAALFIADGDPQIVLLLDGFIEFGFAQGADHRFVNVPRSDVPFAVHLAVSFGKSVTGDAGDPFARDLAALPQRHMPLFAALRADRLVAADAEGADCALAQIRDLLLELVEHRRNRRISVVRRGPFGINLLVAGLTLACRRIGVFRIYRRMRIFEIGRQFKSTILSRCGRDRKECKGGNRYRTADSKAKGRNVQR